MLHGTGPWLLLVSPALLVASLICSDSTFAATGCVIAITSVTALYLLVSFARLRLHTWKELGFSASQLRQVLPSKFLVCEVFHTAHGKSEYLTWVELAILVAGPAGVAIFGPHPARLFVQNPSDVLSTTLSPSSAFSHPSPRNWLQFVAETTHVVVPPSLLPGPAARRLQQSISTFTKAQHSPPH